MSSRLLLFPFVVVLAAATLAPPARAQSAMDLVDACRAAGGSTSLCYGPVHGPLKTGAGLCRDRTGSLEACRLIDGVHLSKEAVSAHERSWLAHALSFQRDLDDDRPLHDESWVHTHNSFNADAYSPTISGFDRNHIYTIGDQLRMGARAIELDLHWAESPGGDPANGFKRVLVCHGNRTLGGGVLHFGCGVNDDVLRLRLLEIKRWLDDNPDEILMIYLQNELDDDPAAHDEAAAEFERAFGRRILKPKTRCGPLPMDTSRSRIRDSGARVIFTGDCGPGRWGSVVHDRGPRWKEGGLAFGNDFPAYPCADRRKKENFAANWTRHWGDETSVSAGAGSGGDVTLADAKNMTRCGVNMIGLDNLVPFDERLQQLVWSWAPDQPSTNARGSCATHGRDGRFRASPCGSQRLRFACFDGASWSVTKRAGTFSEGLDACEAEGHGDFAVPTSGYENERLKDAKRSAPGEVWINYRTLGSRWMPGIG